MNAGKKCTQCGVSKPPSEFRTRKRDGIYVLRPSCRSCERARRSADAEMQKNRPTPDETTKTCVICCVEKPSDNFRMWHRACKDCTKAYNRSEKFKELRKENEARRRAEGGFKAKDQRDYKRKMESHPERVFAKEAVKQAISQGTLIRPSRCEKCGDAPAPLKNGSSAIHGHHDDYTKPLSVRWLCGPCHRQWHRENELVLSLTGDLEKPASFCSRCGGKDQNCYICGKSASAQDKS